MDDLRGVLWLCDAATTEAGTGKVGLLGAGWNATTTPLPPFAIVAMLELGRSFADRDLRMLLELLDASGEVVKVPVQAEGGVEAIRLETDVRVGDDDRTPPELPLHITIAIPVSAGMPLIAGQIYTWRLTLDGKMLAAERFFIAPPAEAASAISSPQDGAQDA